MAPKLIRLMSSDSKKKEPRYTCLCAAKGSHSQRMWAEVSSSAPHFLHSGLSDSPIRWWCLLRVLCPLRRPVTALGCVLLKDRNLALAPRQGPEISSWACLWVSPRPHTQCWLTNQCLMPLRISCVEAPKASSGPTNFRAGPSLARSSAISFPGTLVCPGTQYSPTAFQVDISFNAFWHCWTNGNVFWQPGEPKSHVTIRADTYTLLWSTLKVNFVNTCQDSAFLSCKDCGISS